MYTPYTEYIDALGSSQRGGRDGERETAPARAGVSGCAPRQYQDGISMGWGGGAARQLLIAHVLALLLRLQDAHPPLVPGQG